MSSIVQRPDTKDKSRFSESKLRQILHRVWVDHILYTRLYIISFLNDLPDANVILNRLIKNQRQIGDVFTKIYGAKVGDTITTLLQQHIAIAGELLKAIKSGDEEQVDEENKKWHENGRSLTNYLSKLNPYWKRDIMLNEWNRHLALTTKEITGMVTKNYDDSIIALDELMIHARMLGERIADGILAQNPKKF